ncbi:hypothetical protein SIID45300_02220 [Candidatus Magnetaquicoccaceae bacterium FCR-1]|uniref:HPt domain-containing protein n=1 Tax=Candidatus Magnetaquiglobus chichijimensis TaxID=3141448 RepID=A0ABQ0CAG6_9PROT
MLEETSSQLRLFVQESQNRVKICQEDLATLEQEDLSKRSAAFERLLRTTRGIGGSARFQGLTQLVRLCQALESFLGRFRDHLLHARPGFIEVVMQTLQKLSQLLEDPTRTPALSIEREILAIQALLTHHADPPEFDLKDYPQAVAQAVTQGLDFYSLHIPQGGDPEANRHQFEQIKVAIDVVASVIAAKPDLGARFVWRENIPGGMIRLLLSTVLPGEILHGLIQLPQERIVRLEIPESLRSAVADEVARLNHESELQARALAEAQAQDLHDDQSSADPDEINTAQEHAESAHADALDEMMLGETELQARQAHLQALQQQAREEAQQQQAANEAAAQRQRSNALQEQARRQERELRLVEEQQRQEAENRLAAERRQRGRRRWMFGGVAAAGLLVLATQQANLLSILPASVTQWITPAPTAKEISSNKTPQTVKESPTAKPAATTPAPAPAKPATAPTPESSSTTLAAVAMPPQPAPAPPASPPAPVTAPPAPPASAVTPPAPVAAPSAPTAATPASTQSGSMTATAPESITAPGSSGGEKGKGKPSRFSLMIKEQNQLPGRDVQATGTAKSSDKPAVPLQEEPSSDALSWKEQFARYDTQMVRLTKEPYERFKPAKNTRHGSMRVKRNADGDMLFSINEMMGHTAIRGQDTFTLTPDSMAELRLVLQVEHGRAYMFKVDRNGEVVIPQAFWTPFSQNSKKAVSISRVVKERPDGLHLKDLTALTISYILRTTAP